MSPRFVLGGGNVPCLAEVLNRSLKADCTDFISDGLESQELNDKLLSNLVLSSSPFPVSSPLLFENFSS